VRNGPTVEGEHGDRFRAVIIGFTCNWCSYRAADVAGTTRLKYAPNVRLIRLMCSGRIDPTFVLKALADGADGVLITGCHPGDCHYLEQNYKAMRRYRLLQRTLAQFGIEPERVPPDLGERSGRGAARGDHRPLRRAGEGPGPAALAGPPAPRGGNGSCVGGGSRGGGVMKPKFAMYWAASCGGCEIAVLNIDAKVLDLDANFDVASGRRRWT